jgi:hypothetical protein
MMVVPCPIRKRSGYFSRRHFLVVVIALAGSTSASLPAQQPVLQPQSAPGLRAIDPPCFDNENRFVDCGNGTVTDAVTGLVWLKDAACLGVTDWAAGSAAATQLREGTCGLSDGSSPGSWRLPTLEEWRKTIAIATSMGCSGQGPRTPPALTNDPGTSCISDGPSSFVGVQPGGYWTSTTHEQHPNNAWVVSLIGTIDGFVFPAVKSFTLPAWPVRTR